MSIIEVKVPQLSESVSEASLLTWHKQVGQAVKEGENLIDIETDKVVLELPAIKSGVLVKIIKADGAMVGSGETIAQIDTAAIAQAAVAAPAAAAPVATAPAAVASAVQSTSQPAAVSPSARKLAHVHDVDAASLQGSGRGGLVTKEDVLGAVQQPASRGLSSVAPVAVPAGDRPEQRVPMTRIRQRIAERLLQSQQNSAILTTFNEVNMQPVIDLRNKYKEAFEKKHGVKLGFSSFFVKAVVIALQKFPIVNASVDGTDIIYHGYFDIGMAIGSERGLVVPILRDADKMSLADIEKSNCGVCCARQSWQDHDGRIDRRYFLHHQRRRVRLHAFHPHYQPAAKRHSRHSCHQGPSGSRERPSGHPPDELPRLVLRSPHHRWPRSRAIPRHDQRSAGGIFGASAAGSVDEAIPRLPDF